MFLIPFEYTKNFFHNNLSPENSLWIYFIMEIFLVNKVVKV